MIPPAFLRKPPWIVTTGRGLAGENPHKTAMSQNRKLQVPENLASRYGLDPGKEVLLLGTPDGLLIRPADPTLEKVIVEPTTACNKNCSICMRRSWHEPEGIMEMATFNRLIESLYSVASIRNMAFWGIGEPLLHPHISEMVLMAKKLGVKTELITNGLLLKEETAEALLAADLDTLVLSIDETSPDSKGAKAGADFHLVLENMERFQDLRCKWSESNPEIGIEFVVTKRNRAQLRELPSVASALEASFIMVTNVLPYSREYEDEILYWLSPSHAYPRERSVFLPELILPLVDGQREYMEPFLQLIQHSSGLSFLPNRCAGPGEYCPFVQEGTMAVTWDGGASPCAALMHSYTCYVMDREKFIREYKVGNVKKDDITRIWDSLEYKTFRTRVSRFDFSPCLMCGGCHFSETNEEDCFGNTFPVCGDCLWARGVILCP